MRQVKINRKDVINIVCRIDSAGGWIKALLDKGYTIDGILKVESVGVLPNSWNIVAIKEEVVDATWMDGLGA